MYEPRLLSRLVVVIAGPSEVEFAPTGSDPVVVPVPLPVDNLRDAARWAGAIEPDGAETPLPLLRIDVADTESRGTAISFPADPRLLAGLIADAARVTSVAGAVILGVPAAERHRFGAELAQRLAAEGFRTDDAIEGWRVVEAGMLRSA